MSDAARIRVIAMYVEGVLTTGDITYNSTGEIITFNAQDAVGLTQAAEKGFITALISSRESKILQRIAKELRITHLYQNVKDRDKIIAQLAEKYSLGFDEISYMGTDLPDLSVMQKVGFATSPSNAIDQVKSISDFVAQSAGGSGAIRELTDLLIRQNPVPTTRRVSR